MPDLGAILNARKRFELVEPRGLFYRAARQLVNLARSGKSELSLAESLAVLLQTWNVSFYRFKTKFDTAHFNAIELVLSTMMATIDRFSKRTIDQIVDEDAGALKDLFTRFELVLGPVGAAKCLHLLAPSCLPLWDREIASKYKCGLGEIGTNAARYWCFLIHTQGQVEHLKSIAPELADPLKAIDEFNYCTFTLPKLEAARKNRSKTASTSA